MKNARTNLLKGCALSLFFALAPVVSGSRDSSVANTDHLVKYSTVLSQGGTGCPLFACGADGNHNETLARDWSTPQADLKSQLPTTEKSITSARLTASGIGGGCPPFMCGSTSNHNETMVRDARLSRADVLNRLPTDVQSLVLTGFTSFVTGGGCPPFMCGTSSNHNETLVRDASSHQANALSQLLTNAQWFVLTRFASYGIGGGCPPFACGTDSNHNETLVRDMAR